MTTDNEKSLTEQLRDVVRGCYKRGRSLFPSTEKHSRYLDKGYHAGVSDVVERLRPLQNELEHFERTNELMKACSDDIMATLVNNLRYYKIMAKLSQGIAGYSDDEKRIIEVLEQILRGEKLDCEDFAAYGTSY